MKFIINILFTIYYLLLITAILGLSSCYLIRIGWYHKTTMKDYKIFPYKKINTAKPSFRFYEGRAVSLGKFKLPSELIQYNNYDNLLSKTKTLSFLIIRNDSILFENYFSGNNDTAIFPSYSVAKSFVSALLGIAIDEGYIKDIKQPVTDYLEGLKDKNFSKVTIEDLLNMKTGIKFNENYSSPFSDVAKYYFGPNLKKYIRHLKVKDEPGKDYDYVSVSALLLSLVVEKATGQKINDYLQEKIWKPLGMEFNSTWSVDSKKNQVIKAFCCLNARTRDFAKFGRLYLNNGNWNGNQIISKTWIKKSLTYYSDSGANFIYNFQWRVGNLGDYFAKGAKGQYIYVYPSKKIIIVRTGDEYGIERWENVFRKISEQL
jgi:CubicO group peptidase (beta-lactamase class C family)